MGGGDNASHLYVNVYVKGHPTTHPITTNPLEGPSCCVSEHSLHSLAHPIPPDNEAHSLAILAIPHHIPVGADCPAVSLCRPCVRATACPVLRPAPTPSTCPSTARWTWPTRNCSMPPTTAWPLTQTVRTIGAVCSMYYDLMVYIRCCHGIM